MNYHIHLTSSLVQNPVPLADDHFSKGLAFELTICCVQIHSVVIFDILIWKTRLSTKPSYQQLGPGREP